MTRFLIVVHDRIADGFYCHIGVRVLRSKSECPSISISISISIVAFVGIVGIVGTSEGRRRFACWRPGWQKLHCNGYFSECTTGN